MDQVTEEEQQKIHFHSHALKGDLEEIGAIPLAHDQAEHNPHNENSQRKKNERYAELLHTITQAQEAYNALMDRFSEKQIFPNSVTFDNMNRSRVISTSCFQNIDPDFLNLHSLQRDHNDQFLLQNFAQKSLLKK